MLIQRSGLVICSLLILQSCLHNAEKTRRTAMEHGDQFYKKGLYADAEIQFRRAIQATPQSGEAYLQLGRTEERLGKYREALASLGRAVQLMPNNDAPKIDMANFMLVAYLGNPQRPAGLYQDISTISDELLSRNGDSFEGARLKGYLAVADKRPSVAVEFFEKADRIRPNQPDVITALAESLTLDGKKQDAEARALAFLREKPSYGPLYTFLYQQYMEAGRQAEAESILKSKIDHNPKEGLYRIELARHYARTGRSHEMSEVLNQLLADPKDFPSGHQLAGDFYVESRNWAQAREQYEEGLRQDSRSKLIYLRRLVQTDLATNDKAAAGRDLDEILKDSPRDAEARASRAALLMAGDDAAGKRKAAAEFKELVDESPQNIEYRSQYASALRAAGELETAREQYRIIGQRQPGNLVALQSLADLSIQGQHIDDALTFAGRVLAIDPGNIDASLVKAAALATQKQYNETRSILTRLANSHPGLREAQLQLALLDVAEAHYPEAEKRFRQNYEPGKGDIRSLEGLVEVYRAQNQLSKAVTLLKGDLKKGPQSNPVRALLAHTAEESGDYDLAVEQYTQLVKADPGSAGMTMQLAMALLSKGDAARAVDEFRTAEKLAPGNAAVLAYLGRALDEAGRRAEAIEAYRRSLSLDNRNPWVMNNLAYLVTETGGDLNEALRLATEAVRSDPGDASFSDTLGWIYLKRRNFASAIQIFESARDKNPKQVEFRIHLGQALLAAGNRNQSQAELKTALGLPCTPEERDRITRLLKDEAEGRRS